MSEAKPGTYPEDVAIADKVHQAVAPKVAGVKPFLFWIGVALLVVPGLLQAYLLMPFPGSQNIEAITVCYYLDKVVMPLRVAGIAFVLVYGFKYFSMLTTRDKIVKATVVLLCVGCYYFTEVMFKAESMFREPGTVKFADALHNKVPLGDIVIGVTDHGVAKAYPVIYLGYHHKVQDDINHVPLLVTYCTMCRTGRVYSPVINGKRENFRLVGARHYNAIIEDQTTKSWWYQATGVAAAGKLRGQHLKEFPYEQMTLESWLEKHPASGILQPDQQFAAGYLDLKMYDRLQPVDKDSTLMNKDALIRKSWVLGVEVNKKAKAYDWRQLVRKHLLNDQFNSVPLLLTVESDSLSYHVWNRVVDGRELHFKTIGGDQLIDLETSSLWNWDGICEEGKYKGSRLNKVQAYQEYWHSWQHFHPGTVYTRD